MKKDFIKIGKITTSHGIKGEVKVLPCNDEINNISNWPYIFVKFNNDMIKLHINSIKHIKQFTIIGFKEFNNINDVLKFKNCNLYIKFEDAEPLREGQYYIDDLINLEVYTDDGEKLGILYDVLETGANDVYEIHTFDNKEVLIPAIPDCILDINLDDNKMYIHLLEGLI